MDDQIVISRIKQGDLNGLDLLVNRYQVRAVHAAYLVVYDRALAEDIPFLHRNGGNINPDTDSPGPGWISQAAEHACQIAWISCSSNP